MSIGKKEKRYGYFGVGTLFLLLLLFQSALAYVPYDLITGPTCVVMDTVTKQAMPLSPEKSQYNVVITDGFAHIRLIQTYVNRYENVNDIAYVFPLPHEGSVHAMSMLYQDSLYEAIIYEREEAIQKYDSVKAAGGNAALLLQERPNIFQQKLANIAVGDTAIIEIELSMPLKYDNGEFELAVPTMVAARYGGHVGTDVPVDMWNPPENVEGQRLQFNVLLKTGYPVADLNSPTHPVGITDLTQSREIMEERGLIEKNFNPKYGYYYCGLLISQSTYPNRDYVLRFKREHAVQDFSLASYMDKERRMGYFALSLYPDPELMVGTRPDLEVVLLIDISGSQGGWPLQKEKESSNLILDKLLPTDRLSVLSFNTSVRWAFGTGEVVEASSANIETARTFVNGLSSGGGTNLLAGVQAALSAPLTTDHKRIYIFLTDGFITNETAIFDEIKNHPTQPTVFTFGAGNNLNRYFLDEAAKIGNGFSTEITQNESVEDRVNDAWEKIEAPQLQNISISFGDAQVSELIYPVSTNLYRGSPYTVYGQYAEGGSYMVTLTGDVEGQPVTLQKKVKLATTPGVSKMLPQIWARQKIAMLRLDEGTTTKNKEEIIGLSIEYQVLTIYTAFLAIDPQPQLEAADRTYNMVAGNPSYLLAAPVVDMSPMMVGTEENQLLITTPLSIEVKESFLWIHLPENQKFRWFRVYDLNGRVLFEWRKGTSSETEYVVKWDGRLRNGALLKPGRYFIQIRTNQGVVTKTFTWLNG
jgi:Ca-activated chloride channel family protein